MSDSNGPQGYLAKYGGRLISGGYKIIPIKRGSKKPPFDEWQKTNATKALWETWVSQKFKKSGVGILTAQNPSFDIDCLDQGVADKLEAFIRREIGDAPVRYGMAPKRLLLFRSETPFPKINSTVYEDEWGDPTASYSQSGAPTGHLRKLEVLGKGQQFVAYAVHPDTGLPYKWIGKGPASIPSHELPLLTEDAALAVVAEFDRLALDAGWEPVKAARALARPNRPAVTGEIDHEDVFATDIRPVEDLSEEEIHARLLMVPGCEDHDTWFQIGMALYHQFEGGPRGLELWHEWSAPASNYDPVALDTRYPTFDIEQKGRQPVTARLILKLAAEEAQQIATEKFEEVRNDLSVAGSLVDLKTVADRIKHIEFEQLQRLQLTSELQKSFKRLTGGPLTIGIARDMLRYENPSQRQAPPWLDGWVYVALTNSFFSVKARVALSMEAFSAMHNRFLLTKRDVLEGKMAVEGGNAAMFALNNYQVETVQMPMYLPGEDDIFWFDNKRCVNTYSALNVPPEAGLLTSAEREAIQMVKCHFAHLFDAKEDREIFLHALAFIVQNPGQRLNWAILLQGTEGDGKSFFSGLLKAVLGPENVHSLVAQTMEEKFSGWAEGAQVNFFEEIKLHGHNRFDVLNKVKPLITNTTVSIRRMQTDVYEAINTITYILTTNHRDALPLDDNDSRYFILFSRFQSKETLEEFEASDPTYYDRLYSTLEHAGALRKWLLEHEIPASFSAKKRAPKSQAKSEMVSYSRSEEEDALIEILSEGRTDLSAYLLDSGELADAMTEKGAAAPYGRAMNTLLLRAGFTRLGKVNIDGNSKLFWSKKPRLFLSPDPKTGQPNVDPSKVKNWLKAEL